MITVELMLNRMKGKRESLREKRGWLVNGSTDSLLVLSNIVLLNDLINEFEVYNK